MGDVAEHDMTVRINSRDLLAISTGLNGVVANVRDAVQALRLLDDISLQRRLNGDLQSVMTNLKQVSDTLNDVVERAKTVPNIG